VTGIDVWSNVDMGGNSEAATQRNLEIEGVAGRCDLVSAGAQEMPFADASFDVVVSNLCLHNIYDRATRERAVREIARVLKPGGVALISDYKKTGEYAATLRRMGFAVERRWGSLIAFPPLRVVVARKP
jgi:ubiquinone/menaquinone biosynthesis C-methylase UbiE